MEFLTRCLSFLLLIGILIVPFFVLIKLKKNSGVSKFFIFLIISLITLFLLMVLTAWWVNTSNEMLLNYYGYDVDAMNTINRFKNVSVENMEKVKEIEGNRMGIGWPLKAILGFIVSSPYLLIVYLINYIYTKYKIKANG